MILALCAIAFCACAPKQLTLLHLNDTHSHNDPLRSGEAGVIERAAYIDSVRAADGEKNVLLLHAGDFSQGTSYFTIMRGDLETNLINALGYDCITLGNHEFDNGLEELGRRLANTNCPVVVANYDFSPFEAGKYIKPYAILEKAGL
jgi:5'-nucleotidase